MSKPYLVITWIVVIFFGMTLAVTLAGMVGWVQFSNPDHLDHLFTVLIVEIVALGVMVARRAFGTTSEYFTKAQSLYQSFTEDKENGREDEALKKLNQIIQLSDEALPFRLRHVFLGRGEIAYKRKLWAQAVESYAIYLELAPNDVDALTRFGRALRGTHDYERAESIYKRAFALAPQNWEVLNGLQNCLRRLAGFFNEADRRDVADRYFEESRGYILSMIRVSRDKDKRHYQVSCLALARLNWQWERYPESITKYEEILTEFPDLIEAQEDLAGVLLEYGQFREKPEAIQRSRSEYLSLLSKLDHPDARVFAGAGLAEATAELTSSSEEEIKEAATAVTSAIANNPTPQDDPYPLYALALILWRTEDRTEAIQKLGDAIHAEKRRSTNPYTFDYVRLRKYEALLEQWK